MVKSLQNINCNNKSSEQDIVLEHSLVVIKVQISSFQNKICFIRYYIKLIKYVQKFLPCLSSSTSGSLTGALVQWHSLQMEAQFKPAFLQEQLFPHGPLQLQHTTLSGSGGPASLSIIIGVNVLFSITHPHLSNSFSTSLIVFKFESNDKLEAHDKILPRR